MAEDAQDMASAWHFAWALPEEASVFPAELQKQLERQFHGETETNMIQTLIRLAEIHRQFDVTADSALVGHYGDFRAAFGTELLDRIANFLLPWRPLLRDVPRRERAESPPRMIPIPSSVAAICTETLDGIARVVQRSPAR
jgi:hypothetical protein